MIRDNVVTYVLVTLLCHQLLFLAKKIEGCTHRLVNFEEQLLLLK